MWASACSADDIAKKGVGKLGGEKERESGKWRGPASIEHHAHCLQAHARGRGLG